jgi:hypothetical protein
MSITGVNFLNRVNEIVTGDKFLREVELSLHGHIRAANDNVPLVTGDVPTWCADGISFDDGETAFLDFNIPQDYDESQDLCALRLHEVPSADAADTTDLGITTAQSIYRVGAAVDAAVSDAVAEDAVASTGQLVRENVLDISGRGYKPGDRVRLTLDANNSGGTELILLGIDLIYSGDVAAFNDDDRFRDLG